MQICSLKDIKENADRTNYNPFFSLQIQANLHDALGSSKIS